MLDADIAVCPHLNHTIDHHVGGVAAAIEVFNRSAEERLRPPPVKVGEDDQAGMNLLSTDQPAEIPGILCDKHGIHLDAPAEHLVVRFAEPSYIAQGSDDVEPLCMDRVRYVRRDALVQEQEHLPAGDRRSTVRMNSRRCPRLAGRMRL